MRLTRLRSPARRGRSLIVPHASMSARNSFGPELFGKRLKLRIPVGRRDELQQRHLKIRRKADEAMDRNSVLSVFIFLYLLKSQVEMLGDFGLALARSAAGNAEIAPQFAVERAFGHSFGSSGHDDEDLR